MSSHGNFAIFEPCLFTLKIEKAHILGPFPANVANTEIEQRKSWKFEKQLWTSFRKVCGNPSPVSLGNKGWVIIGVTVKQYDVK